jgi:hypothetical protein
MRKIAIENTDNSCTDDNAGLIAVSPTLIKTFLFENEAQNFAEYTQYVINF